MVLRQLEIAAPNTTAFDLSKYAAMETQRQSSASHDPLNTNTKSTAKDPRLKNRTLSSGAPEILRPGENGPLARTIAQEELEKPLSRHNITLESPESELQKAFSRHTHNALNTDFLERKGNFLRHEREQAREEYEKFRRTKDRFPVVADQALQRRTRVENEYNTTRQRELKARETEEASIESLIKLLRQTTKEKNEAVQARDAQHEMLTKKLAAMQRELDDLRAQQENNTLRSEVGLALRKVQALEEKIPAMESQFQDLQHSRVTEEGRHQQGLQVSKSQQQLLDEFEWLRKTMHLRVENVKQEASTMKTNLDSAAFQISELQAGQSKLIGRVETIETFPKTTGESPVATETKIASLEQAGKNQVERVGALDTAIEEIAEKVRALETGFRLFESLPPVLTAEELHFLRAEIEDGTRQRKDLGKRLEVLSMQVQEQISSASSKSNATNIPELLNALATMKSRFAQYDNQFTSIAETFSKKITDLAALTSSQSTVQSLRMGSLESAFADSTDKWKKWSEAGGVSNLHDVVKKVQDEQSVITAALGRRPPDTLSDGERRQIQEATNATTLVRKLEVSVVTVQKSLEKHAHMFLGLNQRFNNLTTEALAQQILKFGNKALPKFDDRLNKVESNVQLLRQDPPIASRAIAEVEKRLHSIDQMVQQIEKALIDKHDSLTNDFQAARDAVLETLSKVEDSLAVQGTSHSAYRDSTTQNLKAFEARLNSVDIRIDKVATDIEVIKTRELFPTDHRTKSRHIPPKPPSNHGPPSSDQPKLGGYTLTRSSPGPLTNLRGPPASRTLQDSDEDEEAEEEEDKDEEEENQVEDSAELLAQFQSRPPSQHAMTSRASPRQKKSFLLPSSKRKRSGSREHAYDSERTGRGKASKNTRR